MSASSHPGPDTPLVLTERRGGVLRVTLNRPAKLNALSRELQVQLTGTLHEASRDSTLRCLILTGAGRAFCAGLDLSDVASSLSLLDVAVPPGDEGAGASRNPTSPLGQPRSGSPSGVPRRPSPPSQEGRSDVGGPGVPLRNGAAGGAPQSFATEAEAPCGGESVAAPHNVFVALEALPVPVIAAVNGPAYTGGFELALACDLIIAAPEARFGDTHAALAIPPGAGLSQKLSRLIGMPRAMAVSLAGQPLTGADAFRVGLASHLVPQRELLPLAWKLADAIAALEPAFAKQLKRLIKGGAALPLGEALALEQETLRQWAKGARLGQIQARTGSVMANSRASAASEGIGSTHPPDVHPAHPTAAPGGKKA